MPNNRAPRGTGTLKRAFYDAANELPEERRAEVVKAAIASLRDDLKVEREKAAKAREKARLATGTKPRGRQAISKAA